MGEGLQQWRLGEAGGLARVDNLRGNASQASGTPVTVEVRRAERSPSKLVSTLASNLLTLSVALSLAVPERHRTPPTRWASTQLWRRRYGRTEDIGPGTGVWGRLQAAGKQTTGFRRATQKEERGRKKEEEGRTVL